MRYVVIERTWGRERGWQPTACLSQDYKPLSLDINSVLADQKSRFGMERYLPPSKCPDCGKKLGPIYYRQVLGPHFRECVCGVRMEWNGTREWRRTHVLPILEHVE